MSADTSVMLLQLLADASIRIVCAAAAVAACVRALDVTPAARHAAWAAVVAAMLAMPVLSRALPPITVAVPAVSDAASASDLPLFRTWRPAFAGSPVGPRESGRRVQAERRELPPLGEPHDEGVSHTDRWTAGLAAALVLYALGVALMFGHLFIGWRGAARLVRASTPAGSPYASSLRESPALVAPVTVGIVRPSILLPPSWRRWHPATLHAVLAHERAHVRRGDLAVAFAARVNRCVFWFHPLAWWLERAVAVAAEGACDDAAIAELASGAKYADALVEMARAVNRSRGRIVWLAAGISGSFALRRRIDRVLSCTARRRMTRVRVLALVSSAAAAIVAAAACRPSAAHTPREMSRARSDRALRAALVQLFERDWRDVQGADWDAGAAPLDALDAVVRANPDDLDALRRFLVAYWAQYAASAASWRTRSSRTAWSTRTCWSRGASTYFA